MARRRRQTAATTTVDVPEGGETVQQTAAPVANPASTVTEPPGASGGTATVVAMPLTVSQLISEIAPQRVSQDGVISSQCPPWPADVFAICASLLEKSGAYCGIGTFSPPIAANFKTWPEEIQQIAEVWRVYWANYRQAPPAVQERWQIVQQSREVLVQDVGGRPAEKQTSRPLLHALLELTAIADESLCNAGLIPIGLRPGTDSMALFKFWLRPAVATTRSEDGVDPLSGNSSVAGSSSPQVPNAVYGPVHSFVVASSCTVSKYGRAGVLVRIWSNRFRQYVFLQPALDSLAV